MYTPYVEECSYVNNRPLLCPAPACCQGKPKGLFARRKNYLPQERRVLVSLLSLFNGMLAITNFLVFIYFADFFFFTVSGYLFFWIYTKYESEANQ